MTRTDNIIAWRNASTSKISLTGIENKAVWVRDDAIDLARYVRMLEDLPTYETNAEDAVNRAETSLTEALLVVKLAKVELSKKRVTLQAAE